MKREVLVAPPNSVVLVMDSQHGQIPESMRGVAVTVTSSCVAVGTLEEAEGPTRIRVLDAADAALEGLPAVAMLDTTLEISSGLMVVRNVLGERYVDWPVDAKEVRIRIYARRSMEPDDIAIVMG
jgi:hypothetical protein